MIVVGKKSTIRCFEVPANHRLGWFIDRLVWPETSVNMVIERMSRSKFVDKARYQQDDRFE
jgi:hypothetical protein